MEEHFGVVRRASVGILYEEAHGLLALRDKSIGHAFTEGGGVVKEVRCSVYCRMVRRIKFGEFMDQ